MLSPRAGSLHWVSVTHGAIQLEPIHTGVVPDWQATAPRSISGFVYILRQEALNFLLLLLLLRLREAQSFNLIPSGPLRATLSENQMFIGSQGQRRQVQF